MKNIEKKYIKFEILTFVKMPWKGFPRFLLFPELWLMAYNVFERNVIFLWSNKIFWRNSKEYTEINCGELEFSNNYQRIYCIMNSIQNLLDS